ncbi:hypothetical protein [Paenibacillus pini]|uniref:Uncharacterized protein n=1 Tax=Paenibacillus pini JCM 16418 TaxID=1236976 RepID=W7YHI6_9BACL|nr:hypothetical protein [Paenibacillus pini]GAF10385.1 hypothetical protein JCM16418_4585 [Paenibacillus pini JCM 16418]
MTERLEPIKLAQLSRYELIKMIRSIASQLTEKDAAMKKFEEDSMYWLHETEKARGMFLAAHDERVSLRKALEEAHTDMLDAVSVMEMEQRDFKLMPQSTIKEAAEKLETLLYPLKGQSHE